jgi:AraC family transcriptional regulator
MTTLTQTVPVSKGSVAALTTDIGPLRITRAQFPAGGWIAPHNHDRACIAIMMRGSFDLRFPAKAHIECVPGTVTVEPVGDTHCNCVGCAGAEVIVIQPDPGAEELLSPLRGFLDGARQVRGASLEALAWRMDAELARPDALSPLVVEGLALELLATAARQQGDRGGGRLPWCVRRAEEVLRAQFRDPPTLSELARICGVHPSHLARSFRTHLRSSIGEFVRRLRVEWAADRLRATTDPIARVATDAGFTDQSHLTHRFREQIGVTPGHWRRAHRD